MKENWHFLGGSARSIVVPTEKTCRCVWPNVSLTWVERNTKEYI